MSIVDRATCLLKDALTPPPPPHSMCAISIDVAVNDDTDLVHRRNDMGRVLFPGCNCMGTVWMHSTATGPMPPCHESGTALCWYFSPLWAGFLCPRRLQWSSVNSGSHGDDTSNKLHTHFKHAVNTPGGHSDPVHKNQFKWMVNSNTANPTITLVRLYFRRPTSTSSSSIDSALGLCKSCQVP